MNRYIKGVTALSVLAVLLLVGTFLFNPLGESVDAKQDSKASNKSPLPNALLPVVAKSISKDDPSYHINSTKDLHTANTPRHGLETKFEKSSVTFKSGSDSFELSLDALGRGDQLNPVADVSEVKSVDNRLEYTRGDVTEWYLNSLLGMEQGFTLSQRPDGAEDKVSVVLGLSTKGDLTPNDSKDGKSIIFTDSSGEVAMSYSKLFVYDANHKELESSMKLSDKGIVIAFNDTGATYPVVVDPLVEVQRILASNGNDFDYFGWCSAVYDKFAVVGAPFKGRGYAYIFERDMLGTWNEVEVIRGEDDGAQSDAEFGTSCDIAGTIDFGPGVTAFAVIGAPEDDRGTGSDPGAAYIYERDDFGDWSLAQQIEASNPFSESEMGFGESVAITSEGYVLVGAPDENWNGPGGCDSDRGAAYYFERNGSWTNTQTQRVTASDSTCFDYFGFAVGIDGIYSIIGAPFWDGSGNDNEGAVYAFERDGTWSQNGGAINPSDVDNGDHFGESVDVYTGGDSDTRAIAGAPEAGFGGPGPDGDRGEAYILERTDGSAPNWDSDITRIRSEFPQGGAEFGSCVGIWDGYAIGGSPFQSFNNPGPGSSDKGIATIYTMDDGSWPVEQTIIASDVSQFDFFGGSCDIDGLGTGLMMMDRGVETNSVGPYVTFEPVTIVGAPGNNIDGETDQGAAYLFEQEQENGTITIVKATIPAGFVGDFDFEGSENLPDGNPCEAFSLSDGEEQECGDLPADTYTFFETETNDSTVNVNCIGGTWTPLENGVQIDLSSGNDITCIFANTLPLELTPLFPSIRNLVNYMTASQATPGGNVAFVWGFSTGVSIVGGAVCNGLELGINPFQFLGMQAADGNGDVQFAFFVPSLAGVNPVYAQAVDISTCRASEVVESILTNQ